MGLVKTRRLAAMQKQQRAKAGMKPPKPKARHEFDVRRPYGQHKENDCKVPFDVR